jgi:hypothetical protein
MNNTGKNRPTDDKNRPIDELNNPREPEIDQENEIDDMNDLGADVGTVGQGRHGMESDVAGESGLDSDLGHIGAGTPDAEEEDLVERQKQGKFVGEETTTNE